VRDVVDLPIYPGNWEDLTPYLSKIGPTGKLTNWYRKLAADPANAVILMCGDSTSYEPNDQRLFGRFRPVVTATNGSHTLPTGTITVITTTDSPSAGTMTVAGQSVSYTSQNTTQFLGCTGGSGVIPTGSKVVTPTWAENVHTAFGGDLYGMTADDAHIINGGNNGSTLAAWLAGQGTYTYAQTIAARPDLLIFDWGINDIRLDVFAYKWQTLRDLIILAINRIRTDLPSTDIILRMAGPAATDDVGGLHYIQGPPGTNNPAGGAQAFNDTMRKAYRACADLWPNVVLWDSQKRIFGTKAIASTQTNLWSTQVHPSAYGYALIADYLVDDLIALPSVGKTFPPSAPLQDWGNPVGDAIATTTASAYTVDDSALDNTNQYKLIYAGEYNAQTGTTLLVGSQNNRIDYPIGHPLDVQVQDIVRFPNGVTMRIVGGSIAAQNSGGPIPNLALTGQTIPGGAAVVTAGVVRIYRELAQGDQLLYKIMVAPGPNRYVRLGRVNAGTTTTVTVQTEPATPNRFEAMQWAVSPGDSLYVAGSGANPISLAGATFSNSGTHLFISGLAGVDYSTLVGRLVLVVGNHPTETTGDHLQNQSIVAGTIGAQSTANFTVTYTGARFAKPFNTVIAQPQAAVAAGVTWSAFVSAADQITLRFCNPTVAGVVVGTLNWDFWLVR
jgi:lysophospholipase L1-like esterase